MAKLHKLLLVVLLFLMTGCLSKPQVHIFTAGIEESEIEELSDLLVIEGIRVNPSSLPVPRQIRKHTIIFPALVKDFTMVELVKSTMAEAGYTDAQLIFETEGNHHYSTDNIGVYLVNPDFKRIDANRLSDPFAIGGEDAMDLTFNYFSECPQGSEAQSELNLFPSGVVLLEEFVWDDKRNREDSIVHDGEWESDFETVYLHFFNGGELRYSIEKHSGTNRFGQFQGLTLKNSYSTMNIENCDYTYRKY